MADISFAEFIERERTRLAKLREEIAAKQKELQDEMDVISRELAAIDAYEATKSGKTTPSKRVPIAQGSRGRPSSKQQAVFDLIAKSAEGIKRGGIIEALGVKGDKSQEQSISNALNALKKAGKIASREGRYVTA